MKKLLLSLLVIFTFSGTANASIESATSYVNNIGERVLAVVSGRGSESEKQKQLVGVFNSNVDTDWMGKFALGKNYRTAPKDRMGQYASLYRTYVMNSYIPKFKNYTGEKFRVSGGKVDKGGHVIVNTDILSKAGQPVRVDYRLVPRGESFKIVDIVVEGVSLITTQRSEFGSIISSGGFDALIDTLKKKNAKSAE